MHLLQGEHPEILTGIGGIRKVAFGVQML